MKHTVTVEQVRTRRLAEGGWRREVVRALVELDIDPDAVGARLGRSAVVNNSGTARGLDGAIRARVVSEEVLDVREDPS